MVHQRIAWAAVKAGCTARRHRWRMEGGIQWLRIEEGDVGNAANVQHGNSLIGAAKHSLMEGGHQGRPLPAGRNVTASEVRHHINAGEFCQQRGVVQLKGVASAEFLRAVPHCLAMRANGCDAASVNAGFGE